jgi:hypothetical protein
MEGTQQHGLRDVDIETIPPEPGLTAPLDHVREDEKGVEPVAVALGASETNDAREAPSAEERTGSANALDSDTRDDSSMESSGTVDARDATDPEETVDADATDEMAADDTDSDDVDGSDSGDDSGGDDTDGTDTGDDTGDADDSDSEDAKVDAAASDRGGTGTDGDDAS